MKSFQLPNRRFTDVSFQTLFILVSESSMFLHPFTPAAICCHVQGTNRTKSHPQTKLITVSKTFVHLFTDAKKKKYLRRRRITFLILHFQKMNRNKGYFEVEHVFKTFNHRICQADDFFFIL